MNASFEEKSTWVTLLGLGIAFGLYGWWASRMLQAGIMEATSYLPVFLVCGGVLAVIVIAGHVAAALWERPESADERDRLIKWRAESGSSWVLGVVVLLGVLGLAVSLEGAWVANGLLAGLFVSSIAQYGTKAFLYRRGA